MRRLLTGSAMREADKKTIESGVPEKELILRASTAVAEEIEKRADKNSKIIFVCGGGNNGKDGIFAADRLRKSGFNNVCKFILSSSISGEFYEDYDIIVDCLLGTGLNRPVEGKYKKCIECINSKSAYKISVDVPSGINADNGLVMGVAIKADLTLSIGEEKTGLYLADGIDYSGEVVNKDIGIAIWGEHPFIAEEKDISRFLSQNTKRNVNKGSFHKVALVCGSKPFVGGSLLTANALACVMMGAGYTAMCVPESLYSVYAGKVPETVMFTCPDDGEIMICDNSAMDKIIAFADVIAYGNGLGLSEEIYKNLAYLLHNFAGKMLIDADGLNALSRFKKEVLQEKKCQVILTPHMLEFARLTGKSLDEVISDPIGLAEKFAREYEVTVLLKSAVSVITDGERTAVNITGNRGMAKAGSGDVLSGLTAGLMANNNVFESGVAASYIFGASGDSAALKGCFRALTPTDIIKEIPEILKKFEK